MRGKGGRVVEEVAADEHEGEPLLDREEARQFRGLAARLNYISGDRVDIQYAVKESARQMANPRLSSMVMVKRIAKYLLGRLRLVMKFQWQSMPSTISTYTDSDWAGCPRTARSTSGGIVMIGSHVIKSYSRQQKTVALSSAEAELHAAVAASAETLGVVGLCSDMGFEISGEVYADSSAAIGIAQRSGMGKVRHLKVQALWVQDVRSTGRLSYKKVLGSRNPADVLTKHVPKDLLDAHMTTLGVDFRGGRAAAAPSLDAIGVQPWDVTSWVEVQLETKGCML